MSETRMYWEGECCVHDSRAWATELLQVGFTPEGKRRWDAKPICLGAEGDVVPILRGKAPVPADMHPRRRVVLEGILQRGGCDGGDFEPKRGSTFRSKPSRMAQHRATHARRAPARKRLPVRPADYADPRVPGERRSGMAATAQGNELEGTQSTPEGNQGKGFRQGHGNVLGARQPALS